MYTSLAKGMLSKISGIIWSALSCSGDRSGKYSSRSMPGSSKAVYSDAGQVGYHSHL
ncbi:uncharacterized protein BDZ99DRAFT_13690 [Mytilinidion resinicola]|uniref:Uncharacterized protein n=1 Tax=Mytilinidion resinicola TaxID=574789 RepID=A0A6A6Z885_9PEZI|nr:uncharacterized protein BDZ99DRAFT_13690 [Mytilinidion resinicola]KAF2817331.1 hypothetical protein BDZ99DRAFT_13690 [Mytilinidion resinicola]